MSTPKVPMLKTAGDVVAALGSNTAMTNAVVGQGEEDDEPCEECGGFGWTHDVDTDSELTCEACHGTGVSKS